MILFLFSLSPAFATTTCPAVIPVEEVTAYLPHVRRMVNPVLIGTEPSPEFDTEFPTSYTLLATPSTSLEITIRHAKTQVLKDEIVIVWLNEQIIISDTGAVRGEHACDALSEMAKQVMEKLGHHFGH